MNENAKIRLAILEVLYKARETYTGRLSGDEWIKQWVYESELHINPEKKCFALDVLEELGWIISERYGDGIRYFITGAGVLACEQGQV